jgi:predicted HTH domain antitoxin
MVTVQLDDELVEVIRAAGEPIGRTARSLIVMELYRRGMISRGKAAELLGMTLPDFLQLASDLGIPYIDITEDEWAAERARIDARLVER